MPKPSITKRTTKGAALTYSELDTNFQNLADATVSLTADTGGTQVTADLNGNITLVAGTGVSITGNDTAKTVTITSTANLTPAGSNQQIQYNNNGALGASSGLTYDGVSIKVNGNLESVYHNGDEGGEIFLHKADTNTSITNGVTIDVFQNKLRIFENGGTNRGGYFDIPTLDAGAATDLGAKGLTNPLTSDLTLGNYKIVDSNGEATIQSTQGLMVKSNAYANAELTITPGDISNATSRISTKEGVLVINTKLNGLVAAYITLDPNGDININATGGNQIVIGSSNNGVSIQCGSASTDRVLIDSPLLLNAITTTERNALSAVNGMLIYNSTTGTFQGYQGGSWQNLI